MDIRELESVLAVYQYKSFFEAAYRMDFSISAISKHVSHVEKYFGVKIFERKTKGSQMQLTDQGKILLPAIERVVVEYGNLEWIAESCGVSGRDSRSIGYDVLFGEIGEEVITTEFYVKYPGIDINQTLIHRKELVRMLLSGQLDGIFIMLRAVTRENTDMWDAISNDELMVIPTKKSSRLFVGISESHPLAMRGSIRLEELAEETFLFSSHQNPKRYTSLVYEIEDRMAKAGKELKRKYVDFIQKKIVNDMVAKGAGILPQLIPPAHAAGIVFVPVDGFEVETSGMFVCKRHNQCKTLRNFCECVREYAATQLD